MGIHGIYKEIGPGERIALSKFAAEHYERNGRPLRLAIDISIWLFQMQSGKGGTNPALRTFYYRLLRLITLCIHPLFVFDGPDKPPFKRNKRTPHGQNVVSTIPAYLAKQLLKQFALPFHQAPGEAEAECALLQKEGIVDAVLSEDVDTLMFGSAVTLRNWSSEGPVRKSPTHVNVYDAEKTKNGKSGLDREGMILIALMSGGDYIPEGIPGCGPKLACEAARAGFGRDLCNLPKNDVVSMSQWRERLVHELRTNESKHFRQKHKALVIPDDFPSKDVLGYYTHPAVSSKEKLQRLQQRLKWDQGINFTELRIFTAEAFDWRCISGAKKFIRNLAPAMFVKEMRLQCQAREAEAESLETVQDRESKLVKAIHGKRTHVVTDNMTELRVTIYPIDLVKINLDAEEPDEPSEVTANDSDDDDLVAAVLDAEGPESTLPPKKRGPSTYDPTQPEKIWVLETWVKVGVPLTVQDWEESLRNPQKDLAAKAAARRAARAGKLKRAGTTGGMPRGALDAYTKVTKPGISRLSKRTATDPSDQELEYHGAPPVQEQNVRCGTPPRSTLRQNLTLLQSPTKNQQISIISLLSSPETAPPAKTKPPMLVESLLTDYLPDSVTRRRRRTPVRRPPKSLRSTSDLAHTRPQTPPPHDGTTNTHIGSPSDLPSPSVWLNRLSQNSASKRHRVVEGNVRSPPKTISEWIVRPQSVTPSKTRHAAPVPPRPPPRPDVHASPAKELDMPFSPQQRKKPRADRETSTEMPSNVGPSALPLYSNSNTTGRDPAIAEARRSPRQHAPRPSCAAQPAAWKAHQKQKHKIALRSSLEGAWKYVEQMDLTVSPEKAGLLGQRVKDSSDRGGVGMRRGMGGAVLGSDVSVVDLTASPG